MAEKINRNYLALEMEGGGMLSSVYGHSDPKSTLILRGISDFGDSRKQELDATGKGVIRRYAMNNATRLLWKLLEANILPRVSNKNKDKPDKLDKFNREKLRELIRVLTEGELNPCLDPFPALRDDLERKKFIEAPVETILNYFEKKKTR